MSTLKNSAYDFSRPVLSEPASISYPFTSEEDYEHIVIRQRYLIIPEFYEPMRLDTPFSNQYFDLQNTPPQAQTTFLVEETPLRNAGAGLAQFQRVFANIPASRVTARRISWVRPGFVGAVTLGSGELSTPQFLGGDSYAFAMADTSGFYAGMKVIGGLTATSGRTGDTIFSAFLGTVTAVTTGSITIDSRSYRSLVTNNSRVTILSLRSSTQRPGRAPQTVSVTARVEHSYIQTDAPWDIPVTQKFTIINSDNEETDMISTTTTPSYDDYQGFVDAEAGEGPERYMGNIYEIRRILVKAE